MDSFHGFEESVFNATAHHDHDHDHHDDHHHGDHHSQAANIVVIIAAVIIITFDVLIAVCNLFMLVILRHPHIYDIGEVDIFLYRVMAVVDIVGGLASTTFHLYSEPSFFNDHYHPVSELCLLLLFFCFYTANISVWLQCLITINKYLLVAYPLRYYRMASVKRFGILVSLCAIISLNCAAFLPIPSFPYTASGLFFCRDGIFDKPTLTYDLAIMVSCIALPALITSVLNVRLLAVAISHARKVALQDNNSNSNTDSSSGDNQVQRRRPGHRGIKTIILLVITSYFYVFFSGLFIWTHPLLVTDILHATVSNLLYLMSLSSFWWKLFVLLLTNGRFRMVANKVWCELKMKFSSNR